MRRFQGIILACCLAAAAVAGDQEDWATARESFLCKSASEVREIKTYVADSADGESAISTHGDPAIGCRVDYIKNGTTQTLWSSRTSRSYCGPKAAQLAAKLKSSHFVCSPLRLQQSDDG